VPVLVLYRDSSTPILADDRVKAHLRFGHYGVPYLSQLMASRVNTPLHLDARSFNARDTASYCEACKLTNALRLRVAPPRPTNRRALVENLSHICTNVTGPLNPISSHGMEYVIHFTCMKTRRYHVYFRVKKDDALDAFVKFIAYLSQRGVNRQAIRHHHSLQQCQGVHRGTVPRLLQADGDSAPDLRAVHARAQRLRGGDVP